MMMGMTWADSSKCQLSRLTSTYSSGTDSKNISVERCIPASCMPKPADTLNKEGVKAPTLSVKDCSFISSISLGEKVLLLPVKLPSALIFFVAMILFHEAVSLRENGEYIPVELYAQ